MSLWITSETEQRKDFMGHTEPLNMYILIYKIIFGYTNRGEQLDYIRKDSLSLSDKVF